MKFVNIIAFIAMIVGFTLWSMYEDERKRSIHEDFSSDLLAWEIEESGDNTQYQINHDTLNIVTQEPITLWYDRNLTGNYRISYDLYLTQLDRKATMLCYWGANDLDNPDNFFAQSDERNANLNNYKNIQLSSFQLNVDSLSDDCWYTLKIESLDKMTTLTLNNKTIYRANTDSIHSTNGYWGFHLEACELSLTNVHIKLLR